jgi:hypothetical protein
MSELYNKIFNAIPLHIGETFLEREIREVIAMDIKNALSDPCDHEWTTIAQVKIVEPKVCKKCGKLHSKAIN